MTRYLLLSGILLGTVAGCKSTKTPVPQSIPTAQNSSMVERMFAPKPPGPPKPMKPVETAAEEKTGPLEPKTVALFADLTVEATFNAEELTPIERDRRLDNARQKYELALQQDPKNLEALRGMGRLYTRMGDADRAAQHYKTALQHHPKNHALIHEAALSFGRFDQWQTALNLWQAALELDPGSRKYPRMIGLAQARLGNFEDGYNTLLKVYGEAEARTVMARELMESGQTDAGRQQLELALKADPTFGPAQQLSQQLNGGVQQTGHQARQ